METAVKTKLNEFFLQFKHQQYKKGEVLIRADDEPSGVFYLKSGAVKKYTITKNGEEVVTNIFKPISFFPMSWVINGTQNSYFFEATTDVEVWKAPRDKVIAFVKQQPDVLFDLLGRVFRGIDGMEERMVYLMGGNAYGRLVAELIIQAKRFGKKTGNVIELKISESDLAADTGMTRETVSREIRTLKEKGLVTLNKNTLRISDFGKLQEELADGI